MAKTDERVEQRPVPSPDRLLVGSRDLLHASHSKGPVGIRRCKPARASTAHNPSAIERLVQGPPMLGRCLGLRDYAGACSALPSSIG
jgi:hypothetical protein